MCLKPLFLRAKVTFSNSCLWTASLLNHDELGSSRRETERWRRPSLGPLEVRFFGQFSTLAQETTKNVLKTTFFKGKSHLFKFLNFLVDLVEPPSSKKVGSPGCSKHYHHYTLKKFRIGQKLALKVDQDSCRSPQCHIISQLFFQRQVPGAANLHMDLKINLV